MFNDTGAKISIIKPRATFMVVEPRKIKTYPLNLQGITKEVIPINESKEIAFFSNENLILTVSCYVANIDIHFVDLLGPNLLCIWLINVNRYIIDIKTK